MKILKLIWHTITGHPADKCAPMDGGATWCMGCDKTHVKNWRDTKAPAGEPNVL